jgi:hypothetical protein
MSDTKTKVRHHSLVFQMYQDAQAFADFLDAAGNTERAERVRENCRCVAREHVLDAILGKTSPIPF